MPIDFKPVEADPALKKLGIHSDEYRYDFTKVSAALYECQKYNLVEKRTQIIHTLAQKDLFFLMYFVLDLPVNHPFLIARIYEAQHSNNRTLDLWARAHWKSTTLTFALTIFQIIRNREERIAIFSATRDLAKAHMRKIKTELERNVDLVRAFPNIFYERPLSQAPKWSEDVGLYCKRSGTYNEGTVEAWGLDNLPTGKHFTIAIYDDIIDLANVSTGAQIKKATDYWRMSLGLHDRGCEYRIIGTRYSLKDTYAEIMKLKRKFEVRVYPAEVAEDGSAMRGGVPVYLTSEELQAKYDEMGAYVYNSQMLQNPVAEGSQEFRREWIRYYDVLPENLNYYLLVDSAKRKKAESDYTVMAVIGTDANRNYYLVDMVRDKLNLGERWDRLKGLVQKYPLEMTGYEQYGLMTDVEYMQERMEAEGFYFPIVELAGAVAKEDRIKRLIPSFQRGRFYLPSALVYKPAVGDRVDLIVDFIEEYEGFPHGAHDDMLDCMSRISEQKMAVCFPSVVEAKKEVRRRWSPIAYTDMATGGSWMSQG